MKSDDKTIRPAVAAALSEVYEQKLADPSASFGDLAFMFVSALNRIGHVVVPIGAPTGTILVPYDLIDVGARTFVAGRIGVALGLMRTLDGSAAVGATVELEEALRVCAPKPE